MRQPRRGQPPRDDGRKRGARPVRVAVVTAITLVALLAAAVAGFSVSRVRAGPPEFGALWSIPIHSVPTAHATGAWMVDGTVVRGRSGGFVAHNSRDGTLAWRVPVPGNDTTMCTMSRTTRHGIGTATYGTDGRCHHVMAVDVTSGKRLWHHRFTRKRNPATTTFTPVVVGPEVIVQGEGFVSGFREKGRRWTMHPRCPVKDVAADGQRLLVVTGCSDGTLTLRSADPATGKAHTLNTLPAPGFATASILHTRPTVIAVETTDLTLLSLTDSGMIRARIPYERVLGEAHLGVRTSGRPLPVIVNGGILAATAQPDDAAQEFAAFDLATGKQLWSWTLLEGASAIFVRDLDEGAIFAFSSGAGDTPPLLLRFSPAAGIMAVEATYPDPLHVLTAGASSFATQHRIIVVSEKGFVPPGGAGSVRGVVALERPPRPEKHRG